MSINMAKTIKEERLRRILPIVNKEAKMVDIAKICPHNKRSLEQWYLEYKVDGDEILSQNQKK